MSNIQQIISQVETHRKMIQSHLNNLMELRYTTDWVSGKFIGGRYSEKFWLEFLSCDDFIYDEDEPYNEDFGFTVFVKGQWRSTNHYIDDTGKDCEEESIRIENCIYSFFFNEDGTPDLESFNYCGED